MEDIDAGLEDLANVIRRRKIRSIAVPPLGSGLGGLEWKVVRPRIEEALRGFNDLDVIIFEPDKNQNLDRKVRSRKVPEITQGPAALVLLMYRYLFGLLDPFVTLLELHKLVYFMQIAGQRLRLEYSKGEYGPYAENLRHVLNKVEGHFVSGYADGGDKPDKPLELVPGAVSDANRVLLRYPKTRERLDKVTDLVEGFESAFGLELLSTVHWVLEHERPASKDHLVELTYAWDERKKRFSTRQIGLAADLLCSKGWSRTRLMPEPQE